MSKKSKKKLDGFEPCCGPDRKPCGPDRKICGPDRSRTAAGPQPDRKSNFTPLSRRVLLPVEVYLPDSGFDGPADSLDL